MVRIVFALILACLLAAPVRGADGPTLQPCPVTKGDCTCGCYYGQKCICPIEIKLPAPKAEPVKRPTVTMYTADWCGPCQRMKREVLADAKVRAACDVVYVDCSRGPPPWIAKLPTFLLPGREPLEGYKTVPEFLAWLRGP
jgi:thiol-disulfide isomerase/thioredoxin